MNNAEKEKPFTMRSWEDLRKELSSMRQRSKLFNIVKDELLKRGHWKNRPRGIATAEKKHDGEKSSQG